MENRDFPGYNPVDAEDGANRSDITDGKIGTEEKRTRKLAYA